MAAPRKNYDKAVEMYNDGVSVPKIAAHYGRSKTTMYKILKRRNVEIRQQVAGKPCSVEGCFEPIKARGFCSRHIAQFYAHGKIISAKKIKGKDLKRKCSVHGCERKHRANGFCEAHNQQFRKNGKIISEKIEGRNGISTTGEYVTVLKHGHPYANKRNCVLRSHLVWEEHTGHTVTPPEVIHHINGIKKDDRFENLRLFASDAEHQKTVHRKKGHFGVIRGGVIR